MIYWGLLLALVLEYVRPGAYVPGLLALKLNSLVPALVTVASLVGATGRVPTQQLLSEPNTKLIFGFLGLLLLSVLTADVTDYAWTMFTTVTGYVMLFWVISQQVTDLPRITGVFKTLVFVHLVIAVLNPQLLDGGRQYIQSGAFMGDGNDFALSLNVAIPLCLFLIFESTKARQRLFYLAALAVLVGLVVLTQSRGGTVALGCVGLYYWLKSDKKLAMGAVAAVAVVMIVALAPSGYFERMSSIGDTEEGSNRGRIDAWKAAGAMALDNPILGVGAGHFAIMHGARYGGLIQTAHSIYFLVLGELGLPGIVVFIWIIAANLVANRRLAQQLSTRDPAATRSDRQLLAAGSAALIAYATGGAFLSAAYYPHLYVMTALLGASRRAVTARLEQPGPATNQAQAVAPRAMVPGLSPYFVPRHTALGPRKQAEARLPHRPAPG